MNICLFLRPTREFFIHMETSPLQMEFNPALYMYNVLNQSNLLQNVIPIYREFARVSYGVNGPLLKVFVLFKKDASYPTVRCVAACKL